MTSQKDIAKKQAEIVGQLQQFPIGRTNSGGRAGGMVEVVVTNPLPGQPRVVQAKCANDCPPGEVQLLRADDGSYVALSRSAAQKTSETTTRQVSRKNPTIPKKDKEFWSVTSCFLYSRIKPNQENLTDNGAAINDETSWDFVTGYSGTAYNSYAYIAKQRFDELGDYFTAQDAIDNKLKPDRLITPPGGTSGGAAKDNAASNSSSGDAITIWFYIGNPADALTNGRIVQVSGPSLHPYNGNVVGSGPGYCMEVHRGSFAASAIFPKEMIGDGPLTTHLRQSFPEFGGKIGYAGRVERWRGVQDYSAIALISYEKGFFSASEPNQIPTSVPSWYTVSSNENPWRYTDPRWFEFGWPNSQTIGCASTSWINIEMTALNAATHCGASIDNEQWYWGGDAAPTRGKIDRSNPDGSIGTTGIFVCWKGHLDHVGMAQSYFEAFRVYWGISGSVTKLGSANLYGCEIPGSGGGYPPAPPTVDAARFISNAYGRKAKIILKVCKEDMEPIELELPFQFAAIIERIEVLGGGSFSFGVNYEPQKNRTEFLSYGKGDGGSINQDPYSLENPHATLSTDGEFAYIDILYGAQRIWEEPLVLPVKSRLSNAGFGAIKAGSSGTNSDFDFLASRRPGLDPSDRDAVINQIRASGTSWPLILGPDVHPRLIKDCFQLCQSYVVRLPTKDDKTLTIVASQKYKRGENITLTVANPDNEFNNKFLIVDYRTENYRNNYSIPPKVEPQIYYATFGGLPALTQFVQYDGETVGQFTPMFYKNQQNWTDMDWIHHQLQESPKQYNPLLTVLPPGVFTAERVVIGDMFDLDGKFGRQARAEKIIPSTGFGMLNSFPAPAYRYGSIAKYPLFISFKEQLIGNGIIKNGKLFKWFRVSTASFPLFGQIKRNT